VENLLVDNKRKELLLEFFKIVRRKFIEQLDNIFFGEDKEVFGIFFLLEKPLFGVVFLKAKFEEVRVFRFMGFCGGGEGFGEVLLSPLRRAQHLHKFRWAPVQHFPDHREVLEHFFPIGLSKELSN